MKKVPKGRCFFPFQGDIVFPSPLAWYYWLGIHGVVLILVGPSVATEEVHFEKQIAPILREHCIRCHSSANRKGDFSLETFADLKQGGYVETENPDQSALLDLVTGINDEPAEMPKEGPPLSPEQVALIRSWISQGAKWPENVVVKSASKANRSWWSLQPLAGKSLTNGKSPGPNSIDDFVRAKLADHKLELSPIADRRTLIRRLSFDLHGLPPTPEAVARFLDDTDPAAYEKLVDQMLNSPHYGERNAQRWLDLAHYADTHGFERDQRRNNAWRFRDYVIDAFNRDLPFDRFLKEQIAGDVLWPNDDRAAIATGFLAAGPWDFVGQVEAKDPVLNRSARSLDLDDMVTQVMTATMAMTVNCARCHDHKLDPISQREYYQLTAVFAGADRADRGVSEESRKRYEKQKTTLESRRNEIQTEIAKLEGNGLDLADMVGGGNGAGTGKYRNGIDPRTAKVQSRDLGKLDDVALNQFSKSDFDLVDGVFIPDGKNGKEKIPVSSTGLTVTGLPKTSGDAWDIVRNGPVGSQHSPELGGIDFTKTGHSILGLHANAGITFDLAAIRKLGLASKPAESNPDSGRLRFTAQLGYFGAKGANFADAWVFVDGRKVAGFPKLKRADGLQSLDIPLPQSARFLTFIATDGGNGFAMDQIGFGDPRIKPASPIDLTESERQRLAQLRKDLSRIQLELDQLGSPPRFFGLTSKNTMPETRVLSRGNPETPVGEPLRPAALSSLAMLNPDLGTSDSKESERRAALANWITHSDNPLTSRVIVNRLWQWHFGQGIVETPSDFGYGGGRPSHPELLDWLASELVRRKWSLKSIHRLILTSHTYRQQSSHRGGRTKRQPESERAQAAGSQSKPNPQAIDANNRLLWRQNPRRIEAEAIRDSILMVSGKLNLKRGGPGFEDFQYTEAYAPIYEYMIADQPSLWRRSIYRYVVRTTPNGFLTTFDCPDPANLTPKRLTTTTPLQSLALYNNEFILKQAGYFAKRVEIESGADRADQVQRAFALAIGRKPTSDETEMARHLVEKYGLFALCRSLLNSNEFVYVD